MLTILSLLLKDNKKICKITELKNYELKGIISHNLKISREIHIELKKIRNINWKIIVFLEKLIGGALIASLIYVFLYLEELL